MSPDDERMAKEQFDEISQTASQAIDEARQIAYDLRPYHLDRLGLTQSLEEMIERVAASTSIRFTVKVPLLDGVFSKEGRGDLLSHRPGERQQHRQAFRRQRSGRCDSPRGGCRHAHIRDNGDRGSCGWRQSRVAGGFG